MATPLPPARPNPYVAPGDNWLYKVRVPGHGVWVRPRGRASLTWTVFENAGADYHVTISSGFLRDHAPGLLQTHVSSDVLADGTKAHWPALPGAKPPTVRQQQWLAAHDTGRFDALIAAFDQQLQDCAANIPGSRAYDAAMDRYRQLVQAAKATQRQSNAAYPDVLKDWLDNCNADAYKAAYRSKTIYYFLDSDKDIVLELKPTPRRVMQGASLDPGFVNLCKLVDSAMAADWSVLDSGIVLLTIVDTSFAMLKTDFDACQAASSLGSLSQLVELTVNSWMKDAAAREQYDVVAADDSLMNVVRSDGTRANLAIKDLLATVDLEDLCTSQGSAFALSKHPAELADGVYPLESVQDIEAILPTFVPVKGAKTDAYISKDKLLAEWSKDLKDPQIDAKKLASQLVKYQFCAEELKVGDQADMIVYLWPVDGGPSLFVGLKNALAPAAQVTKSCALVLDGKGIGSLIPLLKDGDAAANPDAAIVICTSTGKLFDPPIFLSNGGMQAFDYDQAVKDYIPVRKAKEKAEAQAKAAAQVKAQAAAQARAASYPVAWNLLAGLLANNDQVRIVLYQNPASGSIIAASASGGNPATQGCERIGAFTVKKEDKRLTAKGKPYRYILFDEFSDQAKDWCTELYVHVKSANPVAPSGIQRYVVSQPQ